MILHIIVQIGGNGVEVPVDNIMRGISKNPTIQTLHKISLSFGMTLAEFLDYPELNEFSFDAVLFYSGLLRLHSL